MKTALLSTMALAAQAANINSATLLEKRQMGMSFMGGGGGGMGDNVISSVFKFTSASGKFKPTAPALTRELPAETFAKMGAKRKQVLYGPYTLNPANGTHKITTLKLDKQSDAFEEALGGLCDNCMVLKATGDVTNKDSKRLNTKDDVYTHHVLVISHAMSLPFPALLPSKFTACPKGAAGGMGGMGHNHSKRQVPSTTSLVTTMSDAFTKVSSNFGRAASLLGAGATAMLLYSMMPSIVPKMGIMIAKGNEAGPIIYASPTDPSIKSGFWIGKGDHVVATSELVNYKTTPQEVYFTIDMEYLPMPSRPANYMDVAIGAIQMDCGAGFDLKADKDKATDFQSSDWIASSNGYVISWNPHMHDGASGMNITVNGRTACEIKAVYGEDGGTSVNGQKWETITSYSSCDPIKVTRGDRVKMTATIDLPKHKLRPQEDGGEAEAMAIGVFYFAAAK